MNPHKASINQPLYSLFIQQSYWFLLWLSNKPAGPVAHWPLEEPPLPRGSVNQLIWVRHDLPNRQPDLSFSTELNTDWNEFSFHLLHLKFNFVFPYQCKIMKLSTWRRLAPLRPWVFDAMKGFLKHFLLNLFILICFICYITLAAINKFKLFVYSLCVLKPLSVKKPSLYLKLDSVSDNLTKNTCAHGSEPSSPCTGYDALYY